MSNMPIEPSETLYLNTEDWEWLQRRLAEPPREIPGLRTLLAETPPWSD